MKELYSLALYHYKTDSKEALYMFRGICHECFRLVKNGNELNSLFKYLYSTAFLYLSFLEDLPIKDRIGYLEYGEKVLENEEMEIILLRIMIQKMIYKCFTDELDFKERIEKLKIMISDGDTKSDEITIQTPMELLIEIFIKVNEYSNTLNLKDKRIWIDYNAVNWTWIIENSSKDRLFSFISIGNGYLDLADEYLDSDSCLDLLWAALSAFQSAFEIDKSTSLMVLMGECYVLLGNALDGSSNDEKGEGFEYYVKAVDLFKQVKSLDLKALPLEFLEFLTEWENELLEV